MARRVTEPYVVVAVQATTQAKTWTNPSDLREVVHFLKESGYRVICIDQKPVHRAGRAWTHIPHGAEDQTGNRALGMHAVRGALWKGCRSAEICPY